MIAIYSTKIESEHVLLCLSTDHLNCWWLTASNTVTIIQQNVGLDKFFFFIKITAKICKKKKMNRKWYGVFLKLIISRLARNKIIHNWKAVGVFHLNMCRNQIIQSNVRMYLIWCVCVTGYDCVDFMRVCCVFITNVIGVFCAHTFWLILEHIVHEKSFENGMMNKVKEPKRVWMNEWEGEKMKKKWNENQSEIHKCTRIHLHA